MRRHIVVNPEKLGAVAQSLANARAGRTPEAEPGR